MKQTRHVFSAPRVDTKQQSIVLSQQVTSGNKLESVSFVVNSGTPYSKVSLRFLTVIEPVRPLHQN